MIRDPAVAGTFYPADPQVLAQSVRAFLDGARSRSGPLPKAIIAPHAGYIYSGATAGAAYARLLAERGAIARVVLVGPSHRVAFQGIATSSAEGFATPLGIVPVDRDAIGRLAALPFVGLLDAAHAQEHSLEVHLPFLQCALGRFKVVPLVVGQCAPRDVAAVLEALWDGPETLIVISSDLSHYLDYDAARASDERTRQSIERLDSGAITPDQACGGLPIAGLLLAAAAHGLKPATLDLRNSGDTAGTKDRVVGYGAWIFTNGIDGPREMVPHEDEIRQYAQLMLSLARQSIESRLRIGRAAPLPTSGLPPLLLAPGAAFVTLKLKGNLRGCIGSAAAWRSLVADITDNAVRAAFLDPRFPPLDSREFTEVEISVSVLTPPQPMHFKDEADLLAQLRPGKDGLIIEDRPHRALFLPAVWELLPQPADFLAQLKRKAGLSVTHWSPTFTVERFLAVEVK